MNEKSDREGEHDAVRAAGDRPMTEPQNSRGEVAARHVAALVGRVASALVLGAATFLVSMPYVVRLCLAGAAVLLVISAAYVHLGGQRHPDRFFAGALWAGAAGFGLWVTFARVWV
ncbi:hypothetical protein ACIGW7_39860 [Streptomyces sp. NPDC053253]|uniref:hypothetical protein n=1 Tax=Streptomyces sp. NPDC053253 TaxID=3365699 RepID=UPI0037D41B1E